MAKYRHLPVDNLRLPCCVRQKYTHNRNYHKRNKKYVRLPLYHRYHPGEPFDHICI